MVLGGFFLTDVDKRNLWTFIFYSVYLYSLILFILFKIVNVEPHDFLN